MKTKLPKLEISTYFFVWISINLYCLYKLFAAQTEVYKNTYNLLYSLGELRPGWRFISRLQDVSDIEWNSWKFFIRMSWFYLLVQFVISEIIRKIKISLLRYWYITSSIAFITLHMGYRQLILICAQPIIYSTILFFGGNKICIWIISIVLLTSYNSIKYKSYFWTYLDREDLNDEEVYLFMYAISWIKLRCISFCIDYMDKKSKMKDEGTPSTIETLINLFSYVLYTPVLYIGPVILYNEFEKSLHSDGDKLTVRLRKFTWDMFIFLFYTFILECAFHFMYFTAMQNDIQAIKSLSTVALCGGGLWMGLEFHMKYVISYGSTAAFARLDNINAPPTPRCIARVHVYSQMWRYFDVGLYLFLVKYIYKPSIEIIRMHCSLPGAISKLMASFCTFVFIFMWHGTMWNIFVWSVLNFLGITLEYFGKFISGTSQYKIFKEKVLKTEQMETRFIAALCTPLLAMSAVSNFYLFAGSKVGNIYLSIFMYPSLLHFIFVSLSLYCCCHASIALKDVPSRTDEKRKEIKSS